jgi:hypothetical protein
MTMTGTEKRLTKAAFYAEVVQSESKKRIYLG